LELLPPSVAVADEFPGVFLFSYLMVDGRLAQLRGYPEAAALDDSQRVTETAD